MDQAKKKTVWPYWVFGSITALASIAYGAMTYWQSSGIMAAFSVACFFFLNLPQFERFSFGPNKIELERISNKVDKTTEKLTKIQQEFLEQLAGQALYGRHMANRFSGLRNKGNYEIQKQYREMLTRMGRQDSFEEIFDKYSFPVEQFDYAHLALESKEFPNDLRDNKDAINEWEALRVGGIEGVSSPDEIETFWKRFNALTPERQERIEDYRYYLKNKTHRRPEEWFKY